MITGSEEKIRRHRLFWDGEGPSLILIPAEGGAIYDTDGYDRRFYDPKLMWEAEVRRARRVVGWPTDGIPTVRPNLGVIFVPGLAGQEYLVRSDQMPWPGEPLPLKQIVEARAADIDAHELMRLARQFYTIHRSSGESQIFCYHPDTQGVFDIAHLLYGDEIFLAMAGNREEQATAYRVLEVSLDLYLRATRSIKKLIDEAPDSMVHGHGTAQGVFFRCGARISEDTGTLLSPEMIERFVMPYIERCVAAFDGCFCHFCGRHERFFERLCNCDGIKAIDLGNPEMYELDWLLDRAARSRTILCSRLPLLESEECEQYVRRIGTAVRDSGARCILRATAVPTDRSEAQAMLRLWRELTE